MQRTKHIVILNVFGKACSPGRSGGRLQFYPIRECMPSFRRWGRRRGHLGRETPEIQVPRRPSRLLCVRGVSFQPRSVSLCSSTGLIGELAEICNPDGPWFQGECGRPRHHEHSGCWADGRGSGGLQACPFLTPFRPSPRGGGGRCGLRTTIRSSKQARLLQGIPVCSLLYPTHAVQRPGPLRRCT